MSSLVEVYLVSGRAVLVKIEVDEQCPREHLKEEIVNSFLKRKDAPADLALSADDGPESAAQWLRFVTSGRAFRRQLLLQLTLIMLEVWSERTNPQRLSVIYPIGADGT